DSAERRKDGTRKIFSAAERAAILAEYRQWTGRQADFCVAHGVSAGSLLNWRSRERAGGEAALVPLRAQHGRAGSKKSPARAARRTSSPEEKRALVEAYAAGGTSQGVLARLFGVSKRSVQHWLSRYRQGGPQALELRPVGRPKSAVSRKTAPAVEAAIVATAREQPLLGVRRIVSQLARFSGLRSTPHEVRRVLTAHQVPRPAPKVKRAPTLPRRFVRAEPNQLWQSDITALWLAKASRHIWLVVFLDDCSRYVVSWGVSTRQTSELVIDALLAGIHAHGKPQEVLTDQGRQYFAWRGKSRFQKVLRREGIEHVVSRAHHPETLGKCERLWKTVKTELWERIQPRDLGEAQARLAHYFAHYNYQRPHQSLNDGVPADRFFSVDSEVRAAIASTLARNELRLALGEKPKKPVYLVGQIDGQSVSLHGEDGKLVVHTPQGGRQEIGVEDIGGLPAATDTEVRHADQACERIGGREQRAAAGCESDSGPGAGCESGERAAAAPDGQEAAGLLGAAHDAGARAGAVGGGDRGGADPGARAGGGDPGELAGESESGGGGGVGGPSAGALVAAEPGGAGGDAGGRLAPAAAQEPGECAGAPGQPRVAGRVESAEGEHGAAPAAGALGEPQPPAAPAAGAAADG
ncbi:MAG TPA: IS3 family transposase, partial [Planctomycetota bacterium]|nr:IS3 family transposase [Planctomycetota bacterium]